MNKEATQGVKTDYTREDLIAICEQAIVAEGEWGDRDTESAHGQLGACWALLRAGCRFEITTGSSRSCSINERTIWLTVWSKGFGYFEYADEDALTEDTYYLPTPERLNEVRGKDWY